MAQSPRQPASGRGKPWLLALGLVLALAAGGLYMWKFTQHPPTDQLLEFTALYVSAPLALSVIAMFAYLRGGLR